MPQDLLEETQRLKHAVERLIADYKKVDADLQETKRRFKDNTTTLADLQARVTREAAASRQLQQRSLKAVES